MPKTFDYPETRNAYQLENRKPTLIDQHDFPAPTVAETSKDHYLRSAEWSFVREENWPRRIRQQVVILLTVLLRPRSRNAEFPQQESFVVRAQRLDVHGRTDSALDLIYDSTDQMLRDGQFDEMDQLLLQLCVNDLSIDVLLGLLTATLPARSRLLRRGAFFLDVKNTLLDRQELDDGLLAGLE